MWDALFVSLMAAVILLLIVVICQFRDRVKLWKEMQNHKYGAKIAREMYAEEFNAKCEANRRYNGLYRDLASISGIADARLDVIDELVAQIEGK